MTRKHFKAIADKFRAIRPDKDSVLSYAQWLSDVLSITDVLKTFNDRFDSDKFKQACGVE